MEWKEDSVSPAQAEGGGMEVARGGMWKKGKGAIRTEEYGETDKMKRAIEMSALPFSQELAPQKVFQVTESIKLAYANLYFQYKLLFAWVRRKHHFPKLENLDQWVPKKQYKISQSSPTWHLPVMKMKDLL